MSKNTSMDKVYDVFAEETRKQARIYKLEPQKRGLGARFGKPQEPPESRKKKTVEPA